MIAVERTLPEICYIVLFTFALILLRVTRLMNIEDIYYRILYNLFKVRVLLLQYTYVILL